MIRNEEAPAATQSVPPAKQRTARLGRYELAAGALIVLAIVARFAIGALGWPQNDSDEGTMGLMAIHIAYSGAHPIFFYGQNYMGALEAYLGAAAFHLFGVSILALRLGPLLLYALFLVSTYLLAVLLFNRRVALVSTALLSFGTVEMLFRQLEAAGGYSETLAFGSLCLLLASWLALTPLPAPVPPTAARSTVPVAASDAPSPPVRRARWLRWAAYAGWGLSAGLGLWSDLLVLPFVVASLALLVVCRWSELRTRASFALALGFVAGAWPLIAYNLTAKPGQDSLSVFFQLDSSGSPHRTFLDLLSQAVGTVLVSLPAITGANPLCSVTPHSAWPLSLASGGGILACTGVHAVWSLGWLVLGVVAALGAVSTLREHLRRAPGRSRLALRVEPAAEWRAAALAASRLAVLAGAAISLATYMLSPAAAMQPWQNARYLLGLLIATPVILSPLLGYAPPSPLWPRLRPRVSALLRYGAVTLAGVVLLAGMVQIFVNVTPAAQAHNSQTRDLIARLESGGMTRIYTDYWTCDRFAFQTDERIVCGVLDERLRTGQNRYAPYLAIVQADPNAAYVFPEGSPQALLMARRAAQTPAAFQRLSFDGYVIYKPLPLHQHRHLASALMSRGDDLHLVRCASQQQFDLGVALQQIHRVDDRRNTPLRERAEPDINAMPVARACPVEVAVIARIHVIRIARMGSSRGRSTTTALLATSVSSACQKSSCSIRTCGLCRTISRLTRHRWLGAPALAEIADHARQTVALRARQRR